VEDTRLLDRNGGEDRHCEEQDQKTKQAMHERAVA
jgi:hypothetical protein